MKELKHISRTLLRNLLRYLCRKVIKKHKPVVITILGDGETAVAREILYANIHQKYPSRRNLEIPEAEFTIPLTVLGILTYPKNTFEWLEAIIKSFIRVIYLKSYSHYLIIEIPNITLQITSFWTKTLNPQYTLAGNLGVDELLKDLKVKKVISEIPQPRIKILKGRGGCTVIDATYFYTSVPMKAVIEVVPKSNGHTFLLTDSHKDKNIALQNFKNIIINPRKIEPKRDDIVILRGSKGTINEKLQKELFSNI